MRKKKPVLFTFFLFCALCSVKGFVKNGRTGEPVNRGYFFIETERHTYSWSDWSGMNWIGQAGSFSISDAAEGVSVVKVIAETGVGTSKPLTLKPNQETRITIETEEKTGVYGMLTSDELRFLRGRKLLLVDDAGNTQAETAVITNQCRYFLFTGISSGRYRIISKNPGDTAACVWKENVIVENGKLRSVYLSTYFECPL